MTNFAPEIGPCTEVTDQSFIELGASDGSFIPFPPNLAKVIRGPQGSLMFLVGLRGRGFTAGEPTKPLHADNPFVVVKLFLQLNRTLVADGAWRQGFSVDQDGHRVINAVRPTVPVGAATLNDLLGQTILAEVTLVDIPSGETFCQRTSFTVSQ